jgi:hypothetical protein
MRILFRREPITARFLSPDGTELLERHAEVRFDPLLGTSSRIAEGVRLPQADSAALVPLYAPDPSCPFCPPRLEQVTPRVVPEILAQERLAVGQTTLFPIWLRTHSTPPWPSFRRATFSRSPSSRRSSWPTT